MASSGYSGSGSDSESESEVIYNTIPIIYTSYQLQKLEELFLECNSPNNNMIEEWSLDLGMEPNQIKYWFHNRMLQNQAEDDEEENNALQRENEILRLENLGLSEHLSRRTPCASCAANEANEEELIRKNAALREEHQNLLNILTSILEDPERFEREIAEAQAAYNRNLDLQLAPPASTESSAEPSTEPSTEPYAPTESSTESSDESTEN